MPTQIAENDMAANNSNVNEIKVKTVYNGEVMIHYLDESITFDDLCKEIRGICRFTPDQVFTIKWVDEENDPCTISSQMEMDEAVRLYEANRDSELVIHGKPIKFSYYESSVFVKYRKYTISFLAYFT